MHLKSDKLREAIDIMYEASKALLLPEPPHTLARRMIEKINQSLKLEGQKPITNYDALRNIESDLTAMIETDRLNKICSDIPAKDPHEHFE